MHLVSNIETKAREYYLKLRPTIINVTEDGQVFLPIRSDSLELEVGHDANIFGRWCFLVNSNVMLLVK